MISCYGLKIIFEKKKNIQKEKKLLKDQKDEVEKYFSLQDEIVKNK